MFKSECDVSACVRKSLEKYFFDLDGEKPCAIYDMVLRQVERPILEVVMKEAKGNQTTAARILGINRNTLRTKLLDYELL
ncbi:MAG: Fis family transcriptional regulator [Betaproteobacteria bacterium]|nr:Fis family transcriptional regulator [Betaproteobacteria bacterium]